VGSGRKPLRGLCRTASRIVPPFCAKCSQPFSGAIMGAFHLRELRGSRFAFRRGGVCLSSRGVVRKVMHDFKYRRQIHFRHLLGSWLAESLADPRLTGRRFDFVVPVPLHSRESASAALIRLSCSPFALRRLTAPSRVNALQRTALHHHRRRIRPKRADGKSPGRLSFTARQQRARFADVARRCVLYDRFHPERNALPVLKKAGAFSVHRVTAARG
jgi:predicted amidophosphoribosyltransferase